MGVIYKNHDLVMGMEPDNDGNQNGEITIKRTFIREKVLDVEDSEDSETNTTSTKENAFRNLYLISFSYFLFFTGFASLANLQSTMNAEEGMGPGSQTLIYLCSMISCFLPKPLIEKLGSKTTYVITILVSCPYVVANFHLRWDFLLSTSVFYGLASGPMNAAMTMYINEMALRYSRFTVDRNKESVMSLFFGINVIFAESTQVFGSAISYLVLDEKRSFSKLVETDSASECGVQFYPLAETVTNENLLPPSDHARLLLTGIYLLLGVIGAATALLLDPLRNDIKPCKGCYSVAESFSSTMRFAVKPDHALLITISMFCGVQSTFYSNEFTLAFIACSWGVHHVGFVTICFGVCGAFMAILVGPLVKCFTQMAVILWAALLNVILCALLFVWQPSPDVPWIYFVIAGVWGMTDAIWWSQVPALYGLMFPNDREAAFSNFYFWSFFGYFLSFSYSNFLTVAVKIYIMLVFLVIGIILYILGQTRIRLTSRTGYVTIVESQ